MFARRSLLLSVLTVPLTFAAAVAADPWWDERARQREWEREREIERRRAEERHERWDEGRARADWERRARFDAQRDWERTHPRR